MAARARSAPDRKSPLLGGDARPVVARLKGVRLPEAGLTVDLALPAGTLCILTGAPGAGKSIILDVLRAARLPREGRIDLWGDDPRVLNPRDFTLLRRRIGHLAQAPRMFEHMTARENVCVPLRLAGRKEEDYGKDLRQLLSFVGLDEADQRPAVLLNETARRKTALARALALGPDLILADEPAAGLGQESAARVMRVLFSLPRGGAAVVAATQDETLAEAAPDALWLRVEDGHVEVVRPLESPL